jgi:hypothetical protein
MITDAQLASLDDTNGCPCLRCSLQRLVVHWHQERRLELDVKDVVNILCRVTSAVASLGYPEADITVVVSARFEGLAEGQRLN